MEEKSKRLYHRYDKQRCSYVINAERMFATMERNMNQKQQKHGIGGRRMKEQTFEDILYMIKRSCDKNFYKGTDYDGMKPEIVRCATDIYIEQMRQQGGKENEQRNHF